MDNSDDFFPIDIIHLLPVNHRFYFYLGMARLMEFPDIADYLQEEFNKKEKYQSFVENTGIEPLKDINLIAISNNKKEEKDENYEFTAVVNSKCDKERLLSHFKADDENETLFVSINTENPLFLTFIDDRILVFSNSRQSMEHIINSKKIPEMKRQSCILSHYVQNETIFGIGTIIEKEKKGESIFNIPFNIFKSIEFVSLFVHQDGEDFIITAHLIYSDKEYVELVSGLMKGIIGILARQVEYTEVKEFLGNIRIEEELDGLKLLLRLTKKNIDTLFDFLKEKKILDKKKPVTEKENQAKPDGSAAE